MSAAAASMQLRIVHRTEFVYEDRAEASYNSARMTPVTTPEQIVLHTRLDVSPKPWTHEYRDYFGSHVIAFEVVGPHDAMTVVATSTVQVQRPPAAQPTTPWAAYAERDIADRWTEYLVLTDLVAPDDSFAAAIRATAEVSPLPGEAAEAVCRLVHASLTPDSVVADVVHRAIGGVRSLGIPARYVSGYVHPAADPVVGATVAGDARAWLEWWDDGWQGFDPCFASHPDNQYVAVATGRDATDVRPLAGIYSGAQKSDLAVSVEITRLA